MVLSVAAEVFPYTIRVILLLPTSRQFVEELLVELLIPVLGPHREEDVAANELMHDLAVGGQAVEDDILVIVQLDHHVLGLPVHIPGLKLNQRKTS